MNNKANKSLLYSKALPILLFLATLFMGMGYAAYTSVSLEVLGTAVAKAQDGVFITDVQHSSNVNAIIGSCKINDYYQTMLNSSVALSTSDSNSSITYSVTVYNSTDDTYYFRGITHIDDLTTYSNPNIVYSYSGITVGDILNSKQSITFNVSFSYKDGIISDNNTLDSYLNFNFRKKYSISYSDLTNITNYPTEAFESEQLIIDLSASNVSDVLVYSNDVLFEDFTFENNILTINNISSDLVIQGNSLGDYDIPITDSNTSVVVVDTSDGSNFNVQQLFDLQLSGINGSSKVITKVEMVIVYTSSTGSKQSITSTITHNNVEHTKTVSFNGKTTNGTVTISFDNLSIGLNEIFTITNSNQKLSNGNISIHSEEIRIYFE